MVRWTPFALVGLLILAFSIRKISSLDVWWHLAAGRWIWEHGQVPKVDVFSHTAAGQPWIDVHWLFQVLAYLTASWLGLAGLTILKALVFLAAFAISVLTVRKEHRGPMLACLALLGVLISQVHFLVRPTFISVLFTAVYLCVLEKESGAESRWLWLLPLCHLIWANMHGVAAVGVVMILIYAAAGCWSLYGPLPGGWRTAAQPSRQRLKRLLIAAALCFAASIINPYGLREVTYAWGQFAWVASDAHPVARLLGELKPGLSPDFAVHPLSYFCLWAFTLLTAASFILNRRQLRPSSLLVYCAFFYLFVSSFRNSILFAVVAIPLATENFMVARENLKACSLKWLGLGTDLRVGACLSAVGLLAVLAAVTGVYYRWDRGDYEPGVGIQRGFYPERTTQWLRDTEFRGKLYNDAELGGYLIWHLHPKVPVFIDGRHEVYGPIAAENALARGDPDAFLAMARKHDISLALVRHADPANQELLVRLASEADWRLVDYDLASALFLRNDGRNAELWDAAAWPGSLLPLLSAENGHERPAMTEWNRRTALARTARLLEKLGIGYEKSGQLDRAAEAYRRAIATGHASGRAHYNLGSLCLKQGAVDEAVSSLEQAVRLAPEHAPAHYNLGVALELAKMPRKAIGCYERAVRLDPQFSAALNNLGRLLAQSGNLKRAEELWTRSLEIDPTQPKVQQWLKLVRAAGAGNPATDPPPDRNRKEPSP